MRPSARVRRWLQQQQLRGRITELLRRERMRQIKLRIARVCEWLLRDAPSFAWRDQTTEAQCAVLGVHAWATIPATRWRDLGPIIAAYCE